MKLYIIKYNNEWIESIFLNKENAETQLRFLITEHFFDDDENRPYIEEYITSD